MMGIHSFRDTSFFDSFNGDYQNKLFRSRVKKFELTVKNPCLSIKFSVNNRETYYINQKRIIIPQRHYRIFNPQDEVTFRTDSEEFCEGISVFLGENIIKETFIGMQRKDPLYQFDKHIEYETPFFYEKNTSVNIDTLGALLLNICQSNDEELKSKGLFYNLTEKMILAQLPHLKRIESISSLKISTRLELYNRINMAKEYIHDNIELNFKISDVARIVFMSEYSFIRQFKEVFHLSPYQYILNHKIEKAKVLLKNKNLLTSEIAVQIGFSDISTFGKCFRRQTGMTPTRFRQEVLSID